MYVAFNLLSENLGLFGYSDPVIISIKIPFNSIPLEVQSPKTMDFSSREHFYWSFWGRLSMFKVLINILCKMPWKVRDSRDQQLCAHQSFIHCSPLSLLIPLLRHNPSLCIVTNLPSSMGFFCVFSSIFFPYSCVLWSVGSPHLLYWSPPLSFFLSFPCPFPLVCRFHPIPKSPCVSKMGTNSKIQTQSYWLHTALTVCQPPALFRRILPPRNHAKVH